MVEIRQMHGESVKVNQSFYCEKNRVAKMLDDNAVSQHYRQLVLFCIMKAVLALMPFMLSIKFFSNLRNTALWLDPIFSDF